MMDGECDTNNKSKVGICKTFKLKKCAPSVEGRVMYTSNQPRNLRDCRKRSAHVTSLLNGVQR